MRRRNPKIRNLTPDQEAEMERTERMLYRARIYEQGVAAMLNNSQYANADEMAVAAQILTGAVEMRKEAENVRAEIRKIEREAEAALVPVKSQVKRLKKVTVRPNPR